MRRVGAPGSISVREERRALVYLVCKGVIVSGGWGRGFQLTGKYLSAGV